MLHHYRITWNMGHTVVVRAFSAADAVLQWKSWLRSSQETWHMKLEDFQPPEAIQPLENFTEADLKKGYYGDEVII